METPTTEKGSKGMEQLPEAFAKRNKAVTLSDGGTIIVTKWSAQKLLMIVDYVTTTIKDIPASTLATAKTGDPRNTAVSFLRVLGQKVFGLIDLCVREEDRGKVKDIDAEDLLDVVEAIVELNLTERFLKKVTSLTATFKQLKTASPPSTPTK